MTPQQFEAELDKTLRDDRLSRSERRALKQLVTEVDPLSLPALRNIAFRVARRNLKERGPEATDVLLDWLEEVMKALIPDEEEAPPSSGAYFSPGDLPLRTIIGLLASSHRSCDICVFTITDDRIAQAILDCHKRGVGVRIISDDEKAFDRGSDINRLRAAGVPVRVDNSEAHMHHKFAIFDKRRLLTGSYNWTRSAANHNQENVIVTDDPRLTSPFADLFERLWDELH